MSTGWRAHRPRPSPPRRLRSALALCSMLALDAGALAAQVPGYEEGIVEVNAERLPPLPLLVLIDSAGSVLLPLSQVLDYLALTYTRSDSTLAVARLDGGTTVLRALTHTLHGARHEVHVAPAQLVLADGEFFLHTALLRVVVEGVVDVDLARLTVMITRDTPFPAQQRIVAEQRRAMLMLLQRQREERTLRDTVTYRSYSDVGIADWEVASNGLDPTRLTTVRTQFGVALLGGDLNAGVTLELGRDAVETARDVGVRYHRVFPQSRYVTQVRVGDILSSGLFTRFLHGFEISNRPFTRNYDLGTVLLDPDLPTGWEYEVLQGSQLLGYAGGGSRDPVAVPLRNGTTPVQVRMYGPAGQVVESTLLYQTPVSLLPARSVEYTAGAGQCEGGCERFAHADARWGQSALLTVGAGLEFIEDTVQSRLRPYLVSSFSTGTGATGEVTLMPGAVYSGMFAFFPRDRSSAHLRTSVSQAGFGPLSLLPDSASRWDVELQWDERLGTAHTLQTLRAGASIGGIGSAAQRQRLSAAAALRRGYIELRYDHDELQHEPHLLSTRTTLLLPLRSAQRARHAVLNLGVGVGRVGFRVVDVGASVQPRPNMNVSAGARWQRGFSRPSFSLGYHARVGSLQTRVRSVSSPRGGGTSAAVVSGSVALARDGSLTHAAVTRVGYAGVHGTAFIDRDGDGVFSAGDEPVPHIDLTVGGVHVVADERGRFRAWGLQPYQVVAVALDSTRAADPGLTTARAALLVRPAPNAARRVDVPLVQTRELIGAVTADEDVATTAGLTLEIRDLDSGEVQIAVTFSDGQYYVSRLRPGRYRIGVAQTSLDLLHATARPAYHDFTVSAAGDDIVVELPPIHLRSRNTPRQSAR